MNTEVMNAVTEFINHVNAENQHKYNIRRLRWEIENLKEEIVEQENLATNARRARYKAASNFHKIMPITSPTTMPFVAFDASGQQYIISITDDGDLQATPIPTVKLADLLNDEVAQ
jgi:hypothetical protein